MRCTVMAAATGAPAQLPNFENLHQHILGVAEEVQLLGNVPAGPANIQLMFQQLLNRLNAIDGRLNVIDGRLNAIDGRLNAIDGRLNDIDGQVGAMAITVDNIQAGCVAAFQIYALTSLLFQFQLYSYAVV